MRPSEYKPEIDVIIEPNHQEEDGLLAYDITNALNAIGVVVHSLIMGPHRTGGRAITITASATPTRLTNVASPTAAID